MYTTAKELPKSNLYGIVSSLLPKMIENRSNFVWQGGPFIWTHPVISLIAMSRIIFPAIELFLAYIYYLKNRFRIDSVPFGGFFLPHGLLKFFTTDIVSLDVVNDSLEGDLFNLSRK